MDCPEFLLSLHILCNVSTHKEQFVCLYMYKLLSIMKLKYMSINSYKL